MLDPAPFERIDTLWEPAEWPAATDAYTKMGYRRPFAYYVERVRHLGLSGGLLVDAGCGGGRWSFAWATRFERVLGFDFTPRRLAAAIWQKERFDVPTVEFIAGDVRNIPVADESVDVLYCTSVIFGGDAIEPILRQFLRVLKPGGVCYLNLNALGLAYQRVAGDDPETAEFGRRRIYNSLCRRHLSPLVAAIAPGGARNEETKVRLRQETSPADLLTALNCRSDQVMVAWTVADDLGPAFTQTLLADLAAISSGMKATFGERAWGRDWEPDEMSLIARDAGFSRTEWAPDGWLSLQPDGAIEKTPCPTARPGRHLFEGRLRIFEMLLWKP
jgi:ubiquinone/menaquinone biosynthesis C-methylase UbiE